MSLQTFNQYHASAMALRLPTADQLYAREGLAGEVGELLGYFAKCRRDQKIVDRMHVKKELGDTLWFVTAIAEDFGFSLEDIAQGNLDKLYDRKDRGVLQGSGDNR
jgi:NTP pyrophosphatase (non-canonical NTP hydrolase)